MIEARIAMHSLRLRIVAFLVGLATVLPGTGSLGPHYFCRMMDRVMASPCCKGEQEVHASAGGDAQARAQDCCVRVGAPSRDVTPAARETLAPILTAAQVATIAEPVYVPLAGRRVAPRIVQARAPPPVGPPLFIAHCSLLI